MIIKENKVRVKLYKRDGQVVLIGNNKELLIVPFEEVLEDDLTELEGTVLVSKKALNAGIPHGVYWSEVLGNNAISARVAEELYRVGIFNEDDVLKRVAAVQGALRKALNVDDILTRILDYSREEKRRKAKV